MFPCRGYGGGFGEGELAPINVFRSVTPPSALVAAASDTSRRTNRKIRQNLFWALANNAVGIPRAVFGVLIPMVAGAAMAFSSVSVVSNALLLRRWQLRQG